MQDLCCSDDSSTEASVTSVDHVTDDVRESRTTVDRSSESDSDAQKMTSTTLRHVTSSSAMRSPSRSVRLSQTASQGQGDVRPTSSMSRTQKNAVDQRAGRDDSSVQDLEKMLSQVEASERQAWSWLDSANAEKSERVGDLRQYVPHEVHDLRQYITSMEQSKRQTSEAIAQLLQMECSLRQQLNRKRSSAADPDDVLLDEVRRSLSNIVGRLQTQHGASLTDTLDTAAAEHCAVRTTSRNHSTGSEATADLSHRSQDGGGGGVENDEGYDGNSNSLQSDSLRGYSSSLHGYRDAEQSTTRIAALEAEVVRLTRLLDGYRWSHGASRSAEEPRNVGELKTRRGAGDVDTNVLQAQSDVRRLQSRVNEVETEKLQLEREMNRSTSTLREDAQRLQSERELENSESSRKISQLEVAETSLKRTVKELREQLDFEKDKRQCLEKELVDVVEGREQLHRQLQETDNNLSSLREKLELAEQTNKQLLSQTNFLTKTNDSLIEDIDENNERMSAELASCRQSRNAAEERCTELEAHCDKLTETVQLLAERARTLEKCVEEAEKETAECERLRREHSVLVASEEKLVEKLNDKDDVLRRLMDELSDCKTALEEQSHKLQMANIALDTYKEDGSRCVKDLEDTRSREKELQDSEKQLMTRVRELEKTEAILTTKMSSLEADKEQLCRTESDLKCELDERRRGEKELLEQVASLERREGTLQEKVERLETRATHLVELLRSTQEMSVHHRLRGVFDVFHDSDVIDDTDVVHLLPDSTSITYQYGDHFTDQTSGYDLERMTKVELLTKVYQLERKCVMQRNKIRDLSVELTTLKQSVAEASHRQMDSMLPVIVSTVENKVNCSFYRSSMSIYHHLVGQIDRQANRKINW